MEVNFGGESSLDLWIFAKRVRLRLEIAIFRDDGDRAC